MRRLQQANQLALQIKEELGKEIVGVRVMTNCLLLYFRGGVTRFYSKKNQDWGAVGSMYFVTEGFNRESLSNRLWEQFKSLIEWTEYWVHANVIERAFLILEYNIKYGL